METRDGIYQTTRTATKALRDEAIMAWVTPCDLPDFDPYDFARSTDTLYLLSQNRSAAAPLIAGLAALVMRAAKLSLLNAAAHAGRIRDLLA
ncbi:hypothetical protein ACFYYP_31615 [Microbispora rosea]|uniref:hypothetical protein n=1 Tax=Microbispora rosea TaxID=58117 RepID=UPI0036A38B64